MSPLLKRHRPKLTTQSVLIAKEALRCEQQFRIGELQPNLVRTARWSLSAFFLATHLSPNFEDWHLWKLCCHNIESQLKPFCIMEWAPVISGLAFAVGDNVRSSVILAESEWLSWQAFCFTSFPVANFEDKKKHRNSPLLLEELPWTQDWMFVYVLFVFTLKEVNARLGVVAFVTRSSCVTMRQFEFRCKACKAWTTWC